MPAQAPKTNSDLDSALQKAEFAWAQCAAKIDDIIRCHEATNEQN